VPVVGAVVVATTVTQVAWRTDTRALTPSQSKRTEPGAAPGAVRPDQRTSASPAGRNDEDPGAAAAAESPASSASIATVDVVVKVTMQMRSESDFVCAISDFWQCKWGAVQTGGRQTAKDAEAGA
jgi:hypothetical protein